MDFCKMEKNKNGYACHVSCDYFKGNSPIYYSPEHKQTTFVIECSMMGKMTFSVQSGKLLSIEKI